ncbi:MAG TPA: glycine C-acetyltransferase [Candidatus Diapherotrites archaeon]|uniref:Glycine C-acetyltransferase n=1 Tax=Candidatus Iainarchaeum sp. TaxID=3101447 RepID=A0A7J4JJ25_9ARCH|nr:glycine C-acetyltransferase [Candidatus Diapherotrites archaeon]HIH16850.1 glycine C-acetyltransferase [Candidatus Diapherotrites archaeon]
MNAAFEGFLAQQVADLKASGLYWTRRQLQGPSQPRARVDGKQVLLLAANNYLGLSNHPKVKAAAVAAVKKYGAGSGSVPAIAGTMDLHIKLDRQIAKFKHTNSAIYFQTGFAANAGLLPAILAEGDLVISDQLNHGSIIDGIRLSKAEKAVYQHNDVADLERVLKENASKNFKRTFIVTDGVFSMDGDIAPLPGIVKLAEQFNCITYVDDAHGDGVLGPQGRGVTHHFGLTGKIDVEVGTFSKAFGVMGGYACGSQAVCEYAYNKSRSWLLSGSAPPATVAACTAALQVLERDKKIVPRLWKNTEFFRKGLQQLGFDTGKSQTPIIPVMLGDSNRAQEFSRELFKEGVFGVPIVFPMVAKDKARIRTQMNAAFTQKDLNQALAVFEKVGKRLKVL